MPTPRTFWAVSFGTLTDQFGTRVDDQLREDDELRQSLSPLTENGRLI